MQLKLVYRFLRKISDWTVDGFYSEVYLEGQENVPKEGPLIIASTHHNEIIDIATLAATLPHRRHLSFWAKSTLFANPIAGAILSSSGAIPVRRNPNNGAAPPHPAVPSPSEAPHSDPSSPKNATTKANVSPEVSFRSALFGDTSKALASNQVVGVFPEGTSYTQSSIVQIMSGAGWAAVEYARYVHEHNNLWSQNGHGEGKETNTGLKIMPVAVVYTDKSQYQSRICVRYGEPIVIDSYATELFEGDPDAASKLVVKQIMTKVEKQLRNMTINAPDWDTLCAATIARAILWGDDQNVPLKHWVEISQRLVKMFTPPLEEASSIQYDSIAHLKAALTKYYALLHYTGIKHSILTSLLPVQPSTSALRDSSPSHTPPRSSLLVQPTLSILSSLPSSLIGLILFMFPLLIHLPGYITGHLAAKFLAVPREEESYAQFKAVGGGLGIGANLAMILGILWKMTRLGRLDSFAPPGRDDEGWLPPLKRLIGLSGAVYCSVVILLKWHKLLVKENYRHLQRLLTYRKLLLTSVRKDNSLSTTELAAYITPPPPAANVFIKRREAASSDANNVARDSNGPDMAESFQPPKLVSSRKLIRHLLDARTDACAALSTHLSTTDNKTLLTFVLDNGGNVSQ
ncbi:hypothetical protein BYT27DRAFT_7193306 [Phlegmacium glaucopus]|nr:hypothetical protein BYT27DRAFT_7193306 [Phlegmacium glaucopus]